eukprot:CAMPEP_0195538856 /NCGR_PEP_ID=MMETSP0794_2-20130614/49751_1 /TAXON_ID=515487 /ORGANISM="Stephanopyxis turris, Strain CCMP 815" /LENGTH=634 /DNA_ID=CAMNT_0040672867 /DNA_START=1590 /DNA_END=3494 /DNA_ORIENTATION=-
MNGRLAKKRGSTVDNRGGIFINILSFFLKQQLIFLMILFVIVSYASFTLQKESPSEIQYHLQQHNDVNHGYMTSKRFQRIKKTSPMDDKYITIWLHQVHRWFKEDENQTTAQKVKSYLLDAKESGFTHVMFDIPWAWTERESHGNVQIHSFGKEDVLAAACELNLPLHVVVTMRELPPWAGEDKKLFEWGRSKGYDYDLTTGPSPAHPEVWQMATEFLEMVSTQLIEKYGHCIASLSPTFNNEFETRYSQELNHMRDYSDHSIGAYKEWQVNKGLSSSPKTAEDPPTFDRLEICEPILDDKAWQWFEFREDFLVDKYVDLCKIVKTVRKGEDGKTYDPHCLLHFGEMFSSTDILNSNIFFKLATSEFVDHLVMDSNMALFGAPTSPSIVGILVSTAQVYGKEVHYEAATERILLCDDKGQIVETGEDFDGDKGVSLLVRSGVARALEAGVHSLGITNLCAPRTINNLLSHKEEDTKRSNAVKKGLSLMRASLFEPTAVLFIPYQAFYAYKLVISGVSCGVNHTKCWHESFDQIPTFGHGDVNKKPGMCNTDIAQYQLVNIWDDLRTRHAQVAVIADPDQLTDELLKGTTERVFLSFPHVMTNESWKFFEGEKLFSLFKEKSKKYPFSDIHVNIH